MLPHVHLNILSLTFQASTYILQCWPCLSFFALSQILTWDTFLSESCTKTDKFRWKVSNQRTDFLKNSQQVLYKSSDKSNCSLPPCPATPANSKHSHGLEKSSCKSRSSQTLNVSTEEMDQDLCTSVIVVLHGNLRHQAWLFPLCYSFWSLTWPGNPLIIYNWAMLLYVSKSQEKAAWTHSPTGVSGYRY